MSQLVLARAISFNLDDVFYVFTETLWLPYAIAVASIALNYFTCFTATSAMNYRSISFVYNHPP